MIEGVDDNQKTGLLQVIIPAADALESVSVTTSNYDAEFGRSGGAITNVTLKSGTNTLKGTGFFFGNNEKTSAGDYFSHLKAPTKFVNAGFTLGGPIVRNKLFFFGDYQRTIDNLGYIIRTTVPTAAMRNGDFSAVAQHIYDPLTGNIDGSGRVAFANNQIPRIASARSRRICSGSSRCRTPPRRSARTTTSRADAREDHRRVRREGQSHGDQKDQMSYRLSFMRPVVFDPGLFGEFGGPANGGFAGTGTNTAYSSAVTWTRVINQSTLLDVRGGLNYYRNTTITTGNGLTTSQDIGIPGANLDELHQRVVAVHHQRVLGSHPRICGQPAVGPLRENVEHRRLGHQADEQAHGEVRRRVAKNTDMLLQTQDAGGPRGRFNFNANGTGNPAESASLSGIANPLASFLLDWPSVVQRDLKVIDRPGTRHQAVASFIQDKWQVRSNVTVDLGLRWEYYTPLVGIDGKGTLANYNPTINRIEVAGYGNTSNALNVRNYFKNFGPRTGIQWRLDDKTVVRGGFGSSTIPFPDNRFAFAFPVKQNYQGTSANNFQRQGSMAAGFPAPALAVIPADG
jgi:hypothetical protein